MSRPLPWGRPSMMSISTVSASSRSAIRCASVAPTFPAPTTVTFRFISPLLQVLDDGRGELRGLEDLGPFHLPLEVVGHALLADALLDGGLDRVRRLAPAHVAEHHAAREDHGAGVHLVEV